MFICCKVFTVFALGFTTKMSSTSIFGDTFLKYSIALFTTKFKVFSHMKRVICSLIEIRV
jgi:hypothetical protein